jgi:WD40-like Beta Propeller Repeat
MSIPPERQRQIEQLYRAVLDREQAGFPCIQSGRADCAGYALRAAFGRFFARHRSTRRASSGGAKVTHGGGFASSESLDGKWLYFTREFGSDNSLWKKPVDGGEETQVLPSVTYTNFAIMDDGIYYVKKTEQGFAIEFLNFVTGKSDIVAPIGKGYVGLSVSPDRKWISFSQENPLGSELVLVEGFR